MSNRDKLKAALLHLVDVNNGDGEDHGALIDSIIDTAIEGEISNGIDVSEFPPQAFIDMLTSAANKQMTEEIPCDADFYLPLIVYGLHKSNALLGSTCYFYGEYVSVFLPNLGIGIFVDDEARFFQVNDTLLVVEDDAGEMIDEGCYSENEAK